MSVSGWPLALAISVTVAPMLRTACKVRLTGAVGDGLIVASDSVMLPRPPLLAPVVTVTLLPAFNALTIVAVLSLAWVGLLGPPGRLLVKL